jgi:hypothetical protein
MEANEIINLFWESHPDLKENEHGGHNDQNATVRTAFNFFIDGLHRDNVIDDEMANNITLDGDW